jgi:tRNA (guanine-N7-)-methyltransferase
LKFGGKLYTITDVEELNDWHVDTLNNHPCFRRLSEEEIVINKKFIENYSKIK